MKHNGNYGNSAAANDPAVDAAADRAREELRRWLGLDRDEAFGFELDPPPVPAATWSEARGRIVARLRGVWLDLTAAGDEAAATAVSRAIDAVMTAPPPA